MEEQTTTTEAEVLDLSARPVYFEHTKSIDEAGGVDIPTVLPADHPLLSKFQQALREHLLKVQSDLTNECAEQSHQQKLQNVERENVGSQLYDVQQTVKLQHNQMDKMLKTIDEYNKQREKDEERRTKLAKEDTDKDETLKSEHRQLAVDIQELHRLNMLRDNLTRWTAEIELEVKGAKMIAGKDAREQRRIAEEKKQMDFVLFGWDEAYKKSNHELEQLREQHANEKRIVGILNQSLSDANADIEMLEFEQKRLLQSWSDVLLGISHRDKLLNQLKKEIFQEEEMQKNIECEIIGAKKSTQKEMENNEMLELERMRLEKDIERTNAALDECNYNTDAINREQDGRNLLQTQIETDISKTESEINMMDTQLTEIERAITLTLRQKMAVEDDLLLLLQHFITVDKECEGYEKQLRDSQESRRAVELALSISENQLASFNKTIEEQTDNINQRKTDINEIENECSELKSQSNQVQVEISETIRQTDIITRERDVILLKWKQQIASSGEAAAAEKVVLLKKAELVEGVGKQVEEVQQEWLVKQEAVVELAEKRNTEVHTVDLLRKQTEVMQHKKVKVNSQLEDLENIRIESERQFKILLTKLDLVSAKLSVDKQSHESNEWECKQSHCEFMDRIRECELQLIELHNSKQEVSTENDQLLREKLIKEREGLTWETKWKLMADSRKKQKEEEGEGSELASMKCEIHRMQIRYAQLKKAQEKLVGDAIHRVSHRDHIYESAAVREKTVTRASKAKKSLHHRLQEAKGKLKHVIMTQRTIERDMQDLQIQHDENEVELKQKRQLLEDECVQTTLLMGEIQHACLQKQENLENIVRFQNRAKRYRLLTNGKNPPKFRTDEQYFDEIERQRKINSHLRCMLEEAQDEFTDHNSVVVKILQTVKGSINLQDAAEDDKSGDSRESSASQPNVEAK